MNRAIRISLMASLAVMAMTGCRKELCYDHDHWKSNVVADWELAWERDYGMAWEQNWDSPAGYVYDSLRPAPGTGIAVLVYKEDGTYSERHIGADGGLLPLGQGLQSMLFYNDDTEYIIFSGLDSHAEASASTRTRTRASYAERHGEESTVSSPDMLYGSWVEDYVAPGTLDASPVDLAVTMKPLVYRYLIIYEFARGIEHVRLARGALAGMAQSVYLQDGRTGEDKATILFEDAVVDQEHGVVTAVVRTFGVPNYPDIYYPSKTPEEIEGPFGLNLETMLPDGSIKVFEFDITDQMAEQPRGGVITVSGLTIDEHEFGGGGGFDVDVDDWGPLEDVDLEL